MRLLWDRFVNRFGPRKKDGTPAFISQRPRYGTCPGCGAHERDWCSSSCPLIDGMDYR